MRDLTLGHCRQALYGEAWAIQPDKLQALAAVFERRQAGGLPPLADLERLAAAHRDRLAAALPASRSREVAGLRASVVGSVAVLPLIGTVVQRPGVFSQYSGGVSAERFAAAAKLLLAEDEVKALVLDVDSPGGSVAGVPEAADELFALRGRYPAKPTVAVSNTLMASAAYWLASATQQVVASPSSLTGSIGVYAIHEDQSRADDKAGFTVSVIKAGRLKAGTLPFAPLSDDARKGMQRQVDAFYAQFVSAVSRHLGVSSAAVRGGLGEGEVLTAHEAVIAGLARRVETLPQVVRRLSKPA